MKLRKSLFLLLFCCVSWLAGAKVESWRLLRKNGLKSDTPSTVSQDINAKRGSSRRDEATERSLAALRRQVAELERELAQRKVQSGQSEESTMEEVTMPETSDRRERGARDRQSWEERMERMKSEEPERYAEMQQRREEFRQQIEQRVRDRSEFLDAIDVAGMNAEQRANHQKLLETVARANELGAQMMQSGFGRGEDQQDVRQEFGETMGMLNQLYEAERKYLLEATAKAAGYSGNDVPAFTEHIQSIYENTSMPGLPGMPGGGMTPGMGWGNRRGGGATR